MDIKEREGELERQALKEQEEQWRQREEQRREEMAQSKRFVRNELDQQVMRHHKLKDESAAMDKVYGAAFNYKIEKEHAMHQENVQASKKYIRDTDNPYVIVSPLLRQPLERRLGAAVTRKAG